MTRRLYPLGLLAALTLVLLAACTPEYEKRQMSFMASTEPWQSSDEKVRLDNNEQWIYWEMDDKISIASNTTENTQAWLEGGGGGDWGEYSSIFLAVVNEGSKYFMGLHPYSEHNVITYSGGDKHHFNQPTIYMSNVQSYRTDDLGDHTFDRQVLPMVAWSGRDWVSTETEPRLDFHTLAGLVRLQFYNQTGSDQAIKQIDITAVEPDGGSVQEKQVPNKDICGLFTVKGQHGANPSLTFSGKGDLASSNTITIKRTDSDGATIDFPQNELKSFYVVLPALVGQDSTTVYKLQVAITNAEDKMFRKNISVVRTRRRGITYLQAMGITAFNESNGAGSAGLVGNGTEERPFKLYTAADMVYLRNQMKSGGLVNGQTVDVNTVFHVMNNITLPGDWNEGIQFKGIMRYRGNSTTPGITNNTGAPLFKNITAGSRVEGLTVRYNAAGSTLSITAGGPYSPFATENHGTISGCHVTTSSTSGVVNITPTSGYTMQFGGICAINHDVVENCDCTLQAEFNANVTYGGIAHTNSADGVVRGCNTSTPLAISGPGSAGGIVHTNQGMVRDCYYAAQLSNVTVPWGGIVYHLEAGEVQHCYAAKSATLSSSGSASIGGIVHNTNTDIMNAIVYCWTGSNLRSTDLGGIVYNFAGGLLLNSFVDDSSLIMQVNHTDNTHYAGALVGRMSGSSKVENSYAIINHMSMPVSESSVVCGILVGDLAGGTVTNCYSLNAHGTRGFYGNKAGSGVTMTRCYQVSGTVTDANLTLIARNDQGATLKGYLNVSPEANWLEWEYDATGLSAAAASALMPWLEKYTLAPTDGTPHRKKGQRR